eukprot:Em0300g4a
MLGTVLFLSSAGFLLCGASRSPPPPLPTVFPPTAADGWELVGSLDMLDYKNQKCPNQLRSYDIKRACGRMAGQLCSSFTVPTGSNSFRQVCGRFRAFQVGSPDGFSAFNAPKPVTIDGPYVDGISITYMNAGKREHVFTYAGSVIENSANGNANVCPCAGGTPVPLFVRNADHYCESGNPGSTWSPNLLYCDPLTLARRVSSDLEVRLCGDEGLDNEDTALESYELYVR